MKTGDGFGASMMDLLNQPINERALETLLAGDWQVSLNQNAQQSCSKNSPVFQTSSCHA